MVKVLKNKVMTMLNKIAHLHEIAVEGNGQRSANINKDYSMPWQRWIKNETVSQTLTRRSGS